MSILQALLGSEGSSIQEIAGLALQLGRCCGDMVHSECRRGFRKCLLEER